MKKVSALVISTLLSNMLLAESIDLKSGWNLVGFSNKTDVETLKSLDSNISKIYRYDGEYRESGDISPSDGVWVLSNSDITLNLKESEIGTDRIDKIELKEGWNLKSLPINSALTPKIFAGNTIWKYSDSKWSRYSQNSDDSYPQIDILASGEGFWVKADSNQTIYLSDRESQLSNFASQKELEEYIETLIKYNANIRANIMTYPTAYPAVAMEGDMATTSAPTTDKGSSGVTNSTTTNTQEQGVDEADIIKHNGDKIFYLSNDWSSNGIYVTTFDRLLGGESKPLTTIKTTSRANELYLIDNTLVVVYPTNYNFWSNWDSIDYSLWSEKSLVEFYNISDLNNITLTKSYEIDGNIVDSRVTNSKLYLVTRFMPNYKVEYAKDYNCKEYDYNISYSIDDANMSIDIKPAVATRSKMAIMPYYGEYCYYQEDNGTKYKFDYSNYTVTQKNLLPKYYVDKSEKALIDYSKIYAPAKVDQSSFITSISSISLKDLNSFESVSTVGNADTIYASENSIYLVSTEYPIYFRYNDYQERSTIYKFNIKDGLDFSSKGFVNGRILNQFSLSEYNDSLRIATTEGFSWMGDTNNSIYTLKNDGKDLNIKGSLTGLGKAGETIQAVRFYGDKGFVVTFKNTDPLYTIDLSSDTPKKVGELEISGFSRYFHMVDSNSLLSIGREADENGTVMQLKLELFDISNFAKPTTLDKKLIPENFDRYSSYIYSEAEYSHKAFSFRDSDKLFALPISESKYSTTEYQTYSYLNLYKVQDSKIKDLNSSISVKDGGYGFQRGVIFTKDTTDYALFLSGDALYLNSIKK